MLALAKKAVLSMLLTMTAAAVAGAQQKECPADEGKPGEVARAMLALQMAQSAKPEDAPRQLKSAIASLEKADRSKNPVGESFVLGKTLVLWMGQPNVKPVMPRGALGFTQRPTDSIDLVTTIDSAFNVVEQAMPDCATMIAAWRGQKGWVTMVNDAIQQLNADHLDSAEALGKRSVTLNKYSPYGFMVLGNVAQKRNHPREAINFFKKTVEVAGTDTSYADLKRQELLAAGNLASQSMADASGAEKAAYAADAKWAFDQLLKDPGTTGNYADAARAGLASLASAQGDTAAVRATYQAQLANPTGFGFQQLLNAGVTAARAKQIGDAEKLFEAAYQQNPYHRDVLYNLAIMYLNDNQQSKSLPVIAKLISVDPSNGDNYKLYTFAYADLQKSWAAINKRVVAKANAAKDAKTRKIYADSAKLSGDSVRAVTDLALKNNLLAENFPMKVTFNEFSSSDSSSTLGGTIQNNTDQAQTYTMKVDFLDKSGKVVNSQTATVGPVAPKQSGTFKVTGTGTGVAAFRYAPLVDPSTIKPKS
ncbi:MAG TPA: FxLYD domain-containing protein [Gemmatimonadaceae bacterium]|nr:FxLYD domain-containing protein [Gemmatimonadaceae bacterium]